MEKEQWQKQKIWVNIIDFPFLEFSKQWFTVEKKVKLLL
jgi:hypothetical protein